MVFSLFAVLPLTANAWPAVVTPFDSIVDQGWCDSTHPTHCTDLTPPLGDGVVRDQLHELPGGTGTFSTNLALAPYLGMTGNEISIVRYVKVAGKQFDLSQAGGAPGDFDAVRIANPGSGQVDATILRPFTGPGAMWIDTDNGDTYFKWAFNVATRANPAAPWVFSLRMGEPLEYIFYENSTFDAGAGNAWIGGSEIIERGVGFTMPSIAFVTEVNVGNVTVSGSRGTPIAPIPMLISLVNELTGHEFDIVAVPVGADASNWFTNLPTGLIATVSDVTLTSITITISGTPSVISSANIAITIPATALSGGSSAVTATVNSSAVYNITRDDGQTTSSIPTLNPVGLVLLALALGGLALRQRRRV